MNTLKGSFGVGVIVVGVGAVLAGSYTNNKDRRGSSARRNRKSLVAWPSSTEHRILQREQRLEIRGLRNVGNSCFINAVLQSLASLPPFRDYLKQLSPPLPFTSELLTLMEGLSEGAPPAFPSCLSPRKLRSLLRDKVGRFGKDDQQDAQELFQMVMRLVGEEAALCLKNRDKRSRIGPCETGLADILPHEEGRPSNESGAHDNLESERLSNPLSGSLAYVRRCTVCDAKETRIERFVDLSLTLPEARNHIAKPVDLVTILQEFTEQQLIEDFECPKCTVRSTMDEEDSDDQEKAWAPKRVRAHMRMLLGEAPTTLCLHFPRRHQSSSGLEIKLEQRVNFPTLLDVTPFCVTDGMHTESIGEAAAVQSASSLANSLPHFPGRLTKAGSSANTTSDSLACSPASTCSPLAQALKSPQARAGIKQALVGGSVGLATTGVSDGGRKELNTVRSGALSGTDGSRSSTHMRGRTLRGADPSNGKLGVEYDLRAVVVHQGGADSGHYTAFRKLEEEGLSSTETSRVGDWVDISDETVNRVFERDVLASQAYMLFYRRITDAGSQAVR